jgi:hypothetical protein
MPEKLGSIIIKYIKSLFESIYMPFIFRIEMKKRNIYNMTLKIEPNEISKRT